MNRKILIDAAFPEETRVALIQNNILLNIDRETTSYKQLRGNIYLAKVIKVEPSLQAAFVNYGGDRHGFLPFSDIHPDYYNIPESDKTDLMRVRFFGLQETKVVGHITRPENEEVTAEDFEIENLVKISEDGQVLESQDDIINEFEKNNQIEATQTLDDQRLETSEDKYTQLDEDSEENITVNAYYKNYKIEDVIRDGQYLLVQVLKEERGEKGVALTTYISLAGKYCVLMGNVTGKGGISKKITNLRDRKILKNILHTINPDNHESVIIRTAGIGRKPEDILRDYLYLHRLWDIIVKTALSSKAPTFIHSEDDLIRRTIRELCDDTVDEIIVEGENVCKTVKYLLKVIIPEENISVKQYNGKTPLFNKLGIENQVIELYNNKIILPSGGSIVIDQTEALVAIDVNSGKSTREKNIEETALMTNLEAAEEIARQIKLRDIGGLIVIDFIDMAEAKNRRTIERALRDATSTDKAKIQIEKLSNLGLLEMSRQRINASLGERVNEICPFCEGRGKVKSKNIAVLNILRSIKYIARDKNIKVITVLTSLENVLYLLNYKLSDISGIEQDYEVKIMLDVGNNLKNNDFEIQKRTELSDEEKSNLNPLQLKGKVNEMMNEESLHNVKEKDIQEYNFNNNCYQTPKPKPLVARATSNRNKTPNTSSRKKNNGTGSGFIQKFTSLFKFK